MKYSNSGFTIAEILVAIAIIAFLGAVMVAIFISTLRGSNKSQILGSIKQNGQAVLEIMDKTIRSADNVICTSGDTKTLVIEKNGIYTRFRFIAPTPTINPTANGKIQQDSPLPGVDMETFLMYVCMNPMPAPIILTDTNTQTGVSVNNGSFTRNQQAGSEDNVTVEFTLGPGVQAPPVVAGQIEPVKFQTTIQLR